VHKVAPAAAALLAGGCAYALVEAATTPFTVAADVITGGALLGMAVLVIRCWPLHASARTVRGVRTVRTVRGVPGPYLPWLVFVIVFVAWELFNYVVPGSRADHPTFSSITDAMDRFYGLKALLILGWLALGWSIIRRGSRPGDSEP
jgi:hypothetical protein